MGVPYIGRDQVLLGPSIHGIYFPIHFMAITLVTIDTRILTIDTSPRSWILRGLLDVILRDIGMELDRCVKSYESKEFKSAQSTISPDGKSTDMTRKDSFPNLGKRT